MSRIVITTWGSYGDVNPYLGLATALAARGHEPVLAMPAHYETVVRNAGFAFRAVAPDADPELDRDMVRRVMDPRHGTESIFREVLIPALAEQHADLTAAVQGADLLVSHPASLAAPIVAEQTGMRWISSVLSPLNFLSAHDPVLPPQAPWLRWLGLPLLRRLGPLMADGGRRIGEKWMEPVQTFRASLGLPRRADPLFDGQHSPDGVLALFSRVFGGPYPDWPPHTTITGQLRYDASHGATLAPALDAFLAGGEPPLVFTLGTSAVEVAGSFWEESAQAAVRLGRRAVLLAGRTAAPALQRTMPPNVLVVDAAPHSLLFPRAAVIVHQCGIGTIGTALHAGRPMLAVPFANDQPDNAWRITRLGVARTVYPRQYRQARVARELAHLLNDASYATRARAVAEVVAQERGAELAADVIERALERRRA